jgi:phosphoribosylanthranilate isomerase
VGVFDGAAPADVRTLTARADLDVVQLHGDARPDDVGRLRDVFDGEIWAVVRLDETGVPDGTGGLFDAADGVLLDSRSTTRLGGTGAPFDWRRVADDLAGLGRRERGKGRLIVAGGLHAGNVSTAIAVLAPDVVDVSSGIESSPGVKDPERMRAFLDAVRASAAVRQR